MTELPSNTLVLHDAAGNAFGVLRFAPSTKDPSKGDCIFDVSLGGGDPSPRDEVRWLAKRAFRRAGEHRFKIAKGGSLVVSVADFRLVFDEAPEVVLRTRPPAPLVTGRWQGSESSATVSSGQVTGQ